jgi:hypothetical protein
MNNLHEWARRWNVPLEVFRDLQITLGTYTPPLDPASEATGKSEAWAQSVVRLEASEKGIKLFRNNVGALKDERGRLVRYGLGNDSPALNEVMKSADLVGIRPVVILQHHVGRTFGQFVSREIKAPNWQYTGAGREPAQLAWANLINACGGDAAFATGRGSL